MTENSMISDGIRQIGVNAVRLMAILLLAGSGITVLHAQSSGADHALKIAVNPADGRYTIALRGEDETKENEMGHQNPPVRTEPLQQSVPV